MEFRVLGPLEVVGVDGVVDLGGPRPRMLLSRLLVDAGQVVPAERLADDLWPGEDPTKALAALRTVVARARRALGAGGELLVTRSPGYVLAVGRGDVDAAGFEDDARAARAAAAAGDHATALARLDAALARWRGEAFADCRDSPFARGEAARLEELRRGALEDRLAARLGLGDHVAGAAEAEALVSADPLRERAWSLLMLALYRSGRQADSLRAYQDLRRTLGEELGIEPSPELVRLEGAILRQDPDLDWRPATTAGLPVAPTIAATAPDAAARPSRAHGEPPTLRPGGSHVLEVAAAAGDAVEFRVLAAACELDDETLADIVDDAIRAGVLVELTGPGLRYRFANDASRAATYDALSATRRVLLHRRIADAIERVHAGRLDEHVVDLARHFSLASPTGGEQALRYVRTLADAARRRAAHGEALPLLAEAVELAAQVAPGDAALRAELLVALGDAQRRTGDPAYRATLLAAADAAAGPGGSHDRSRLAAVAVALGRAACVALDPDAERLAVLETAWRATVDADDPARARLLAVLASELVHTGDWERRVRLSDEATAMARRLDDPEVLADVLTHRAGAIAHPTTLDERLALAEELVDLAATLVDRRRVAVAAVAGACAAAEAGDLPRAEVLVAVALDAAPDGSSRLHRVAAVARAALAAARGASAPLPDGDDPGGDHLQLASAVAAGLVRGGIGALEPALARRAGGPCAALDLARAVALCDAGRADDARRLVAAVGDPGARPWDGAWAAALCLAAEAAARLDDAPLGSVVDAHLRGLRGAFVTTGPIWWGAVSHWLGRAATARGERDAADALLGEAVAAHERAGAQAWAERSRADRAALRS